VQTKKAGEVASPAQTFLINLAVQATHALNARHVLLVLLFDLLHARIDGL
jgi:hypothetical protein